MVNKLNKANRTSNERTEVYFFIDSNDELNRKLYSAIDIDQKILLCEKHGKRKWHHVNYTYPNLSEFISKLLYYENNHDDLTRFLMSHIFKLTR